MPAIFEPINLPSTGHVGHFNECDRENIPNDFGHPGLIKFYGMPLLAQQLQFQRTSNNSFTIYGAYFSLLYETARKLNHSLEGLQAVEGSAEEEMIGDFLQFKPDIVLIPFSPLGDTVMRARDAGFLKISDILFTVENNHVLSKRQFEAKSLLAILAPFDLSSLTLLLTALVFISFLACHFKSNTSHVNISEIVWNLATAMVCCPPVTTKKAVWRFVAICWSFGVFFLQNIFSGDMYTAMTLAPNLDAIDNFDDLALKSTGPITIFDTLGANANNYFSPKQSHRKELVNRIQILPGEQLLNLSFVDQLMASVSCFQQCHIGEKGMLDYYQNVAFGARYKYNVYISQDFVQANPVFITLGPKIEKNVLESFNSM